MTGALDWGAGEPRVYEVASTDEFENDPNVTDKKFPRNPTRSYRSSKPLRAISEVTDWIRLTPEALQAGQPSCHRACCTLTSEEYM